MDTAAKIPNPVKTLQEEAVCAICLDYFTDPVSIRCGHNFCRVCITQLWFRQDEAGEELEWEEEEEQEEEQEWEEEEEEDIEEAVGASVGLETPIVDDDLELDMEEEFEGPVGNRESNWDSVWGEEEEEEEEEEEDQDVVDMQEEHLSWEDEEEVLAEGEEGELDPTTPLSPPEPQRCFTCPQCRKSFHGWSFRPNLQLANMVQVIRQMHPNPAQGSHVNEQVMCPKHQEALKLFCKVDEEAICVVCRESRRHKQHSVMPVEEVVQGYKAKLQGHLEPLRKHLGELQDMKAEEERRLAELNSQMDLELAGSASEFGQLTKFLEEEQAHLQWLIQEMYKAKMGRARANVNHFSEQFTKLSGLLAEVQERSQQGGLLLLQETLKKCQEVLQQPPKIFPPEMSQPLGDDFRTDAIVRKMSRVFCKDTGVNLKPDPDAAPLAPNLSTDSCDPPGEEAAGGF